MDLVNMNPNSKSLDALTSTNQALIPTRKSGKVSQFRPS